MKARSKWFIGAVVAALVAVAVVALGVGASSGGEQAEPPATGSTSESTPASSPAAGSTDGASDGSSKATEPKAPPAMKPSATPKQASTTMTPTPMSQVASFHSGGMTAQVLSTTAVKGKARGVGEISGPAVALEVQLNNDGQRVIPMKGIMINAYYGSSKTPAGSLVSDSHAAPLKGALEPGSSKIGTYVFSVPTDAQGQLRLEVAYAPASPIVVFTGSAA